MKIKEAFIEFMYQFSKHCFVLLAACYNKYDTRECADPWGITGLHTKKIMEARILDYGLSGSSILQLVLHSIWLGTDVKQCLLSLVI